MQPEKIVGWARNKEIIQLRYQARPIACSTAPNKDVPLRKQKKTSGNKIKQVQQHSRFAAPRDVFM